ncbi:MAG: response regulator transcription factor [Proteobacteria bacterium]|nr:response regulator transcription factor [Pseudomonadota bacterium]
MLYDSKSRKTKILIIEEDETTFQVKKCIAKVLEALPPMELFHAKDSSEALTMIDQIKPDVVVLEHDNKDEQDLLIDSLAPNHPPVMCCTEDKISADKKFSFDKSVNYIPKSESIDGIHQTLMLATALGTKTSGKPSKALH